MESVTCLSSCSVVLRYLVSSRVLSTENSPCAGIISKRGKHILWTQKDVKDQLEKWSNKHDDGNGHAVYYPFNGIVVYFLKKKLAMLSKKGM